MRSAGAIRFSATIRFMPGLERHGRHGGKHALRDAGRALSAAEIAAAIIAARRFPDAAHLAVTKMIIARLGAFAKRSEIVKTGVSRDARWVLSAE